MPEWTSFDARVHGTGSLGTRFNIRADEPDARAKTVKISWEAWLTANPNAGYFNPTEGSPCDLFLGETKVFDRRCVFDLRNGLSEQKIAGGSYTVAYASVPNGSLTFSWTFDGRDYWDAIKSPTIISGRFQLPEIAVDYTPTTDKAEYNLGDKVIIKTNAPSADYKHAISYLYQGKTKTVISNDATSQVTWAIPEDEILQAPTTTAFNLSLTVESKEDNKVVFTKSMTIKVNIPASYKPLIRGVSVREGNTKVNALLNGTSYLRGLSAVIATPLGLVPAKGAEIKSFVARLKEKPEVTATSTDGNLHFPAFGFPDKGSQAVTVQVAAIDSRGRQSDWFDKAITVHYYQAPTIGAITPIRTGERVVIKRNWSVMSIAPSGPNSERNSAKLSFFVRPQGGQWAENTGPNSTALSGKDSEAALAGTFPGNAYYEVKVRLEDKLAVVEAGPFNIPTEGFPVSVSANNKVGINKLVDKAGAQVQIRGESEILNLDGSKNPHMTLTKDGKDALKIGFIHDHATDNKYFVMQNFLDGGTWFRVQKDNVALSGRRLAFSDILDLGNSTISLNDISNGFYRLRDKGPNKDEHWSISQTWLTANRAEGFQFAWLPLKNTDVMYRRTKHQGVWKPWKEF